MNSAFNKLLATLQSHLERAQKDKREDRQIHRRNEQDGAHTQVETLPPLTGDSQMLASDLTRLTQSDTPPPAASAEQPAPPQPVFAATSPFIHTIRAEWSALLETPPSSQSLAHILADLKNLLETVQNDPTLLQAVGAMAIQRLKTAAQALENERVGDTITVLKTALRADPHNTLVLFTLSQLEYAMAATGQSNALPEAREHAQKASFNTEKIPAVILTRIRLKNVIAESAFDTQRATDMLRDYGLLQPSLMRHKEGLMAFEGMALYAWVLAAHLGTGDWKEGDFENLASLAHSVVGGAWVYLAFYRAQLVGSTGAARLSPAIQTLENSLMQAAQAYAELAQGFTNFAAMRETPWVVRNRYLAILQTCASTPAFDHVLLHIALDGSGHKNEVYPDAELRAALHTKGIPYWRQWAVSLASARENRQPHAMPFNEAAYDASLPEHASSLLLELQNAERSFIDATIWNDILPWMPRWSMEHLLAAGTGSSKARLRFTPSLMPYSHFYRIWNEPLPSQTMPSEIILQTAQNGAFGSFHEVVAAFHGAARLLTDPEHGLKKTQMKALALAKQQQPDKFRHMSFTDQNGGKHIGVLLVVGLLVIGTVAAFTLSTNLAAAFGLMLALFGVSGVLLVAMVGSSGPS